MSNASPLPLCRPTALPALSQLTLLQRLRLIEGIQRKFDRQAENRRRMMLGSVVGDRFSMTSYDYHTLVLLALAAEYNHIKPWFIPRLVVEVEWLPAPSVPSPAAVST